MSDTKKNPAVKKLADALKSNKPWDYTHSDLLDIPIVINSFERIETGYGDALLAQCTVNDKQATVLIGAVFLHQALLEVEESLPVSTTIVKTGKFYKFT